MKPTAMLEYLAPGIRVSFTYEHKMSYTSSTVITKYGSVIRTIKHRNKFYAQQVAIMFDGNKQESIVHIDRLRVATPEDNTECQWPGHPNNIKCLTRHVPPFGPIVPRKKVNKEYRNE